ncbi:MAG: hypothetical protein IJN06_07000 [Bacteroidales bacterium]|nr:hypothetical protein [Bacteroidales bacterium]
MNRRGYIKIGSDVYTYQVGEDAPAGQLMAADYAATSQSRPLQPLNVNGFYVYPYGENNTEPNEAKDLISTNRLLPGLIEKQIGMLYGRGPALYKESTDKNGFPAREYIQDPEIKAWLENWLETGIADDYTTYLNKCIRSFYYCEGCFSKWRFTRGSQFSRTLPVAGLEHVSVTRCRLATTENIAGRTDFEDAEFNKVLVGNWSGTGSSREYKVYPRFNYTKPLAHPSAISYIKNPTHGEEIYSFNTFYRGVKDWIQGSNLTPKYINDYLANALSARLHIIIPEAWMRSKKDMLQGICERNAGKMSEATEGSSVELEKITFGEDDVMEVGCDYHEGLLAEFTTRELKKLGQFLSGAGKNQGKYYATTSFTDENGQEQRWRIEEIPQKYKEYIEAIKSYDERADYVMLAAKGLDPSISNVSKEGVISKSGSDAYYNYLIYLNGLTIPESVVCSALNYAIKLNFPAKYASGVRIGFYRPTIAKQQDVTPENRLQNQTE